MTEWNRLKADSHRVSGRFRLRDLLRGFIANLTFRPVLFLRLFRMASANK
jgi:hypothetical protein